MERIFLGLGSNQGQRELEISLAVRYLKDEKGIELVNFSSLYRSEPWGVKDQPEFLNLVVEIKTGLPPEELLIKCKRIEKFIGREKTRIWGPRTIDIDVLIYGDLVINKDGLCIPHALISNRRFVLVPLAEICPEFVIPGLNVSVKHALSVCSDTGRVFPHNRQVDIKFD